MNNIDDMQNEMDFSYHYNECEYNQDFVRLLVEFFYYTLEIDVLNNNICLYWIDYYKFFIVWSE